LRYQAHIATDEVNVIGWFCCAACTWFV